MPKKKTALTIEERLQQALVPAEEQPYEVPENWVWVRLGSLLKEIKNGTTIKQDKSGNGFSVTRIESLQNQTIDLMRVGTILETEKIKETDWYKSGDITLSHINSIEHVGKTALITDAMLPLVHGMNLLRLRFFEIYTPDLFQLYSQTYQYKNEIRSRINMAVNQVSINQKQLSSLEIPLPPLSEQQRIVERIEELFAKLDEAKERLQEVVDSFAVRKAAILHKAFTGELTQQWRLENGVSDESWEEKTIGEICSSLKYGTSKKSSDDGEVVVLRMGNLQNGEIDWSNLAYTSDEEDIKKYLLKSGDVLFNRTNSPELVGKTSIYRGEMPAIYAGYLIKLDYEKNIVVGDYLNYYLNSSKAKEYYMQVKTDGVSQSNINAKKIGEFEIPLPTLSEQHEIVRLIDDLLARERAAQQAAEQALASIDLMKKSILARAFRGELGTNKASEASALELLKQVMAEG
ncbi:restriction endonuclease subunit S [Phascolarctobacterium succinatutens]|uniref:restriction endonuclease subunit S n=1 Tax=Phascolarctobacterium succinatutens TaxID=626940 RepID=UPI0030784C74